jgi:hypothetical protein
MLGCKLLALWAFAQAVLTGPALFLLFILACAGLSPGGFKWPELAATAVGCLPALGSAFIGLALWIYAPQLAARMVSGDPEAVTRPDLDHETVLCVAFAAVGLWTLIPSVRDFASDLVTIVRGKYPFADYWRDSRWQARFCSSILGMGLSIWLMIGTRGIVRLVLMLRHRDGENLVLPAGGFEVMHAEGPDEAASERTSATDSSNDTA